MNLHVPATEAALYDLLQMRFGIGEWGPDSKDPWFRARMLEIGKLKRLMKSRRVTIEDLAIATWYAEQDGRPISATWQLAKLVPEARREFTRVQRVVPDLRQQLDAAAADAWNHGDDGWASRLFTADLGSAEAVLSQYREHRSRAR